jgi:hypothetical protein
MGRTTDGSHQVRTFQHPTAGRAALGLALVAGAAWFVAPSAASAQPASHVVRTATAPSGQAATSSQTVQVRIGEAVAYVRNADGTIRRVR